MSLVRTVVCSVGASRNAAQAGALHVLLDFGVVPDLLVGTSVGAISASFLAAERSPERARCLVRIWQQLRTHDAVVTLQGLSSSTSRSNRTIRAHRACALLDRHLGYREIDQDAVTIVVVATDLLTGAERSSWRRPSGAQALRVRDTSPGLGRPNDGEDPGHEGRQVGFQ